MKTVFQAIDKSEKIKEHQLTEYHKRNAEKANILLPYSKTLQMQLVMIRMKTKSVNIIFIF